MADELEKFVLQYSVEMRDAVSRLESLNAKVAKVAKTSKTTVDEIKDFAANATDEIGKLIPGVDKASAAIRALGAEFAVAGLAVGALSVGVKAAMDMRTQYNAQRKEGMEIGVSAVRLEEYRRKFVKASGGNISGEETMANVKKLSEFTSAVFRDPTRVGTEARTARVLGINMGESGGPPKGVNEFLTQLGEKFSKMTDSQVQANAKILGISQDFALGLKKQGATVGQITEQTPEDIASRKDAQDQLDSFNAALARLSDNFKKAENILGERLLPPFTKFVELMAKLSEILPKGVKAITSVVPAEDLLMGPSIPATIMGGIAGYIHKKFVSKDEPTNEKATEKLTAGAAKTTSDAAKKYSASVDAQDKQNADMKILADQEALAINQFAGAVASFANAVDEKQAWAAWAGEVGRAAGLTAPGMAREAPAAIHAAPESRTAPGKRQATIGREMGKTPYDEYFKAAGEKYNLDVNLLKNIARVESAMNPKAISPVGAQGLMQIMPANFKDLGIKDGSDPKQNIMGGAKLLSTYLKNADGDIKTALMMYHGGYNVKGWGPLTKSYPGKVLGDTLPRGEVPIIGSSATRKEFPDEVATRRISDQARRAQTAEESAPSAGESKSKINLKSVQNTIAQRLGIPVGQLQLGGINRGDVTFANSQIQSGVVNNISDLRNQLKAVNLPQQTRSKIMSDLLAQQSGLTMMRQYGETVENRAQPGGRSITIGERAIVINVNAAVDPAATAAAINAHLNDQLGEIVNGTATGMKH